MARNSRSASPTRSDRDRLRNPRRERDSADDDYERRKARRRDEGHEPREDRYKGRDRGHNRDERDAARSSRHRQDDRDEEIEARARKRRRERDEYNDVRGEERYRRDKEREGERRDDEREKENDRDRDRYGHEKPRRERSRSAEGERGSKRPYDDRHSKSKYDEDDRPSSSRPGPSRDDRSRSPESEEKKDEDKGKPNFKNSGLLAAATNTVQRDDGTSTVLKYNEPPEARRPTTKWRLYVFKGKEESGLLHLHDQTCYLVGRDKAVCDIYIEHPSCSKQHAAIQYRQVMVKDDLGASKPAVKPFIIDLDSTNHTYVNEDEIPKSRYYELQMGDVIKFGMSTREYVLLHDDA